MLSDLKKQVLYFINHKWYMVSLMIAAIAGYGYEITHTSMGIDDVCIEIYFEDGLGVAIGRWPLYLINKVFHVTAFEPFIMEFIMVIFMMIAAVLWCAVIREIIPKELPIVCYIAFATMFIDYSLIAEVFIYYLQNGIGFIYCLTAISLFIFYEIQSGKLQWKEKIPYVAAMSAMVCVAISFYESAASLFLLGVILIMMIDGISANRMEVHKFVKCVNSAFLTVRVLVYAIIGRTFMTKICMALFDIEPYNYRSAGNMLEILKYPARIITIGMQIIRNYFAVGAAYYPIGLFVAATVIFVVLVLYYTFKKKNIFLLLMGIAAYASIFVLSIAQNEALPYRANQMLSVFVAVVLMAVCYYATLISNAWIRVIALVLAFSTVYNSAFDLNHWFALEYKRNQIEIEVVHNIADDLRSGGYDIYTKPVVFVGEYYLNYAIEKEYCMTARSTGYSLVENLNSRMGEVTPAMYPYVQVLSYSFLDWSITSFSLYEGYNRQINRLFDKEGVSLIWGGNEYYEKGLEKMEELNRYPAEGYVKEYEDFIVVRF